MAPLGPYCMAPLGPYCMPPLGPYWALLGEDFRVLGLGYTLMSLLIARTKFSEFSDAVNKR